MSTPPHSSRREPHDTVSRVVLQAIARQVPGQETSTTQAKPMDALVGRIVMAVLEPNPAALRVLIKGMLDAEVPALMIAEDFVPRAARQLGHSWVCDELDFAAVTVGSARLQSVLHQLDEDWAITAASLLGPAPTFLVGVPNGVQHTLGASVVAAQLRHRGYHVDLEHELTPELMARRMAHQSYAGVMLSASGAAHLEVCANLVDCSKELSKGTPVVFGGTILEHHEDVKLHTGADFVTTDVVMALASCGYSEIAPDGSAKDQRAGAHQGNLARLDAAE